MNTVIANLKGKKRNQETRSRRIVFCTIVFNHKFVYLLNYATSATQKRCEIYHLNFRIKSNKHKTKSENNFFISFVLAFACFNKMEYFSLSIPMNFFEFSHPIWLDLNNLIMLKQVSMVSTAIFNNVFMNNAFR